MHYRRGFTIVELLIVIVVIAILAAISIVAYNGIQTRANNTAIINSVSQTIKVINAYVAQEGMYPAFNTYACVTTTPSCVEPGGTSHGSNSTFDTNIIKIANPPRSIPNSGTAGIGIVYHHSDSRQFNGQQKPGLLMYFLNGQSQNCGVSNVMSAWGTPGQEASTSATGYSGNNTSTNKTLCFVSV